MQPELIRAFTAFFGLLDPELCYSCACTTYPCLCAADVTCFACVKFGCVCARVCASNLQGIFRPHRGRIASISTPVCRKHFRLILPSHSHPLAPFKAPAARRMILKMM